MMHEQRFTIRFEIPAFLGNAEQAGQWRTPPFTALLRSPGRLKSDTRKVQVRRDAGGAFVMSRVRP